MIIEFKSKIKQGGKESFIEFKTPVKIYERETFTVFEFADPKSKIMNMIEISGDAINIFAGAMTINLHLNKHITTEYTTPHGNIYFISFLKKIHQEEGKAAFAYTLANQNNELLGEYEITITIFSELN